MARNRYNDDTGGKFTSTVKDGKGGVVRDGKGNPVMSRSFAKTSTKPPMKPKATSRAEGAISMSSTGGPARHRTTKASTGGPARHKTTKASTGGPARHSSPKSSTGGPARHKAGEKPKKGVAFPKLHSWLFDRRPAPWDK